MRWAISNFQIWLDLPWRSEQSLNSLGSVICPGACNQRSPFALTDCWLALAICQPPSPCMFCISRSLGPGCILEKNVRGGSRKVSHSLHADLLMVTLSSCTDSVLQRLPSPSLRVKAEEEGWDLSPHKTTQKYLHPFSEAAVSWWDAVCLESERVE